MSDDASSAAFDPAAASAEPQRQYGPGRDAVLSLVWRHRLAEILARWQERNPDGGATRWEQLSAELQACTKRLMAPHYKPYNAQNDKGSSVDEQRAEFERWAMLSHASIIANVGAEGTSCSEVTGQDVAAHEHARLPAWDVQREAMRSLAALQCWRRAGESGAPRAHLCLALSVLCVVCAGFCLALFVQFIARCQESDVCDWLHLDSHLAVFASHYVHTVQALAQVALAGVEH